MKKKRKNSYNNVSKVICNCLINAGFKHTMLSLFGTKAICIFPMTINHAISHLPHLLPQFDKYLLLPWNILVQIQFEPCFSKRLYWEAVKISFLVLQRQDEHKKIISPFSFSSHEYFSFHLFIITSELLPKKNTKKMSQAVEQCHGLFFNVK